MKRGLLLLLLLLISFISCVKDESDEGVQKKFSETSKIYTEKLIKNIHYQSNSASIVVEFYEEQEKRDLDWEKLLSFEPNNISGNLKWISNKELLFTLDAYDKDKNYKVLFSLKEYLKENYKDISFAFSTFNPIIKDVRVQSRVIDDKFYYLIDIELDEVRDKEFINANTSIALKDDNNMKKELQIVEVNGSGKRYTLKTSETSVDIEKQLLQISFFNQIIEKKISYNLMGLKTFDFKEKNDKFKLYMTFSHEDNFENFKSHMTIEGLDEYYVNTNGKNVIISGDFKSNTVYNIRLFAPLGGMEKDEILKIKTPNLEPKLEFKNDGIYLAHIKDKKVRIKSRNIKNVNISLKKVGEDNINWLTDYYGISEGKTENRRYDDYSLLRYGTEVYNKQFFIGDTINTWSEVDIDLSKVIEEFGQKGLYLLEVYYGREDLLVQPKNYQNEEINDDVYRNYNYANYLYNNGYISKGIILSDIGLIMKKTHDRVFVYSQELSTGKSLEGVKVTLDSYSKKIVSYTNEDGVAIFNFDLNESFNIKGEKDENISFVSSYRDSIDYNITDNTGVINSDETLRTYLYTERGVYRPGDKVHITSILFEKDKILPEDQNLTLKVINPQGKVYEELDGKYIGHSLYTYEFETKEQDLSGNWQMELYLGEKLLKREYLKIENIVPPRIKVNNDLEIIEEKLENKISSEYLFGAPSAKLKYESELSIVVGKNNFKEFRNYSFINELYENNINKQYRSGNLDNEGNSLDTYDINIVNGPFKMDLLVKTDVFQNDGRKVTETETISYDTRDYYVGVEKYNNYYKIGDRVEAKVVIVDKEGKELEGDLEYNIYKNETYWWWDYSSYENFKRSYKKSEDTVLVENGRIKGGERVEVPLEDFGEYYLEVVGDNGHRAGSFIKVGYYSDSTNRGDTFEKITLDKKEYNLGDTGSASIESNSDGYAIVTIEDGKDILESFRVEIKKGRNEITFDIKDNYLPGVYVNIIILKDLRGASGEEVRLQGLEYIKVKSDKHKLDVDFDVQDIYTESKNIEVNIKTAEENSAFTLAVVDEGLLSITNYQSPDAYNNFFAKERYRILNSDNYKKILNYNPEAAHKILVPGGGDYNEMYMSESKMLKSDLGVNNVKRIKSTSKFYTGTTDENGEARVDVDLGEYMGQVRFMLVATNNGSFGSKAKSAKVRGDIILEEGLPRVLSPNDKITTTLNIFVNKEMNPIAFGGIRVEGPLKIVGKDKVEFDSSNIGENNFVFQVEALNEVGKGKIIYYYETEGYYREKIVDIAINSNAPYQDYTNDFVLDSKKNLIFKIQEEAVKGSGEAKILVSREPLYNLYGRLNYLIRYPYGCLEQTTSTLFAQLNIDNVLTLSKEELEEIDTNINEGIRRLEKFMLPDGSLGYWESSTTPSKWGSSYAYYFLMKASQKGYYVPAEFLSKLKTYLMREANNTRNLDLDSIYRLYVLSLDNKGNINGMNYYKQNKTKEMSNQEKFLLAGSYANLGYNKIANGIVDGLSYEVSEKEWDYNFGSELRDKAIILDLLVLLGREDSKELYNDIMAKLASKNWYSTQTIAYSLVAVSNYLDTDKSYSPISYEYSIGNKVVRKKLVSNNETIDLTDYLGKDINVTNTSNEKLYFSYTFSGKMKNEDQVEFAKEIKLSADYYDNNGNKLKNFEDIKQGEDIWVVYRLNKGRSKNYTNIALYQNLPSGFEVENQRIANYVYPDWLEEKLNYKQNYSNLDIRDDKIVWFFDWYYGNEVNFVVKLNSVTKGEFYIPGAVVEGMYTDEIGASLGGQKVIIK